MKRIILILSLLTLSCAALPAQTKEPATYRNEWRFGVAGLPLFDYLCYGGFGYHDYDYRPDTDFLYEDYDGDRRMLGLLSAEYSINFSKKFTFAIGGYVTSVWNNVYDYKGNRKGSEIGLSLHVIPTARVNYLSRDSFRIYGSAGLGASAFYDDGDFYVYPTFELVPVGFTVGRKVYFFAEYAIGFTYLGGAAGIGYKF